MYAIGPQCAVLRRAGDSRDRRATAAERNYTFASLVLGVVESVPFQMRVSTKRHSSENQESKHEFRHRRRLCRGERSCGHGRDAGAAAARCDGAGAGGADGKPDAAAGLRLRRRTA